MACKTMSRPYHKIQQRLEEFHDMYVEVAEIHIMPLDYSSLKVAYTALRAAVKKSGLPIQVIRVDGSLYLIRTDWSPKIKKCIGKVDIYDRQ